MKILNKFLTIKNIVYSIFMTIMMFISFYTASYFSIVNVTSNLTIYKSIVLFVWYFLFIFAGNIIIKFLMGEK
jgi:type IV secretory pathway TraG/TraD family ATPase VirD4